MLYHDAIFNSKANSINASLFGVSGSSTTNTEDSEVLIDFGNASIVAATYKAYVENRTTKEWLDDYNLISGSGGLTDSPAAESNTNITKDSLIKVGNGAILTQSGNQFDPGDFIFKVFSYIYAMDKVKLDSGGLIAVSKAKSKINADHDYAQILIGSDSGATAQINAVGDVRFIVLEEATIQAIAHAKTYGFAGAAQGDSLARVNATHQIILYGKAYIETKGNAHLYVGFDDEDHKNRYDVQSLTELWNWTAIPITILDGKAQVNPDQPGHHECRFHPQDSPQCIHTFTGWYCFRIRVYEEPRYLRSWRRRNCRRFGSF